MLDTVWDNKRTGARQIIPQGIDPGWQRNPGKLRMQAIETVLKDKIAALPPEVAKVALRDIASSWHVKRVLQGTSPAVAPIGVLPAEMAIALGAETNVVSVSSATAKKQLREHPELLAEDYTRLVDLLDGGIAVRQTDNHIGFLSRDAAGTAPLTVPGQTIGLAADKSRPRAPITAYAGVQASAGLRPTYGRGPKSRRNLFNYSEFPNGVTDAPVRGGLVSAAAMAGFGGALAFGHDGAQTGYAYKTLNRTGGLTYTLSAIVEMTDGMGPPVISDTPALSDVGFVMEGSLLAAAVYTITALSGGRYRLSAPKLAVGSGTANFGVVKYGTNTARTFKVTAYQIEVAATASAYQCATTAFDLTEAGFPAYGYARLDGADDKLTVTLPSAITGDLMIFGRSGSWIEAGVTLPSGAFDLGPTGTALTPGVLRALGGLVGAVIIGRSTTTTERALALRYFAARGAAGWLVAGAELISNSAFAANLTGWTNGAPSRSTQTWVAGELKMDATAGDGGAPQTTGTLTATATAGLPYLLEWDTRTTDGATLTGFIAGSQSLSGGFAVGGRSHAVVISATDMTAVAFYGTALRTVYFDNMSLKPLTVGA